jgi:hypothetical protein
MFTIDKKVLHLDISKDPLCNFFYKNNIFNNKDFEIRDILPFYNIEKQKVNKNLIIGGENLEEFYWYGNFENLVSHVSIFICYGYEFFHPRYEYYLEHMDNTLRKFDKTLFILSPWKSDKNFSNIKFIDTHLLNLTLIDNHFDIKLGDKGFFGLFRLDKYNRPLRKMFYDTLKSTDLLDDNSKLFNDKFNDIIEIHDINKSVELLYGYDSFIPHKLYHTYNLEIISEVNNENNSIFYPTEKIFKPLMHGFPFVVYANQYFLSNLKNMGFMTFNEIIPEHYDLEKDSVVRFYKVIEYVKKIKSFGYLNFRKQTKEICKHNRLQAHKLKGTAEVGHLLMFQKILKILKS